MVIYKFACSVDFLLNTALVYLYLDYHFRVPEGFITATCHVDASYAKWMIYTLLSTFCVA